MRHRTGPIIGTVPTVVELRRFPVKSARGESLGAATVDHDGLRGDRAWACLDDVDGSVGSAKHPRRWGGLLDVAAGWGGDGDQRTPIIRVAGRALLVGSAEADAALSGHLGRRVRLTDVVPSDARLHRLLPEEAGMVPDWMSGAQPGQETVTAVAGARPGGRFVDFGAVHIVTTGALTALGGQLGRPAVAAARFRANLVIDATADPQPGQELRIGGATLRVVLPTPRCVVPGLSHGELPADRPLLAALARHHRVPVSGFGRAACFGVYAEVVRPGGIRLGQPVH